MRSRALQPLSATAVLFVPALLSFFAGAQSNSPVNPGPASASAEALTILPHPDTWYWISGQANFIFQDLPPFHAPYSGPNSLKANGDNATSRVLTLYTGLELGRTTDFLFDLESAGGRGVGDALGLAGYTNLDVVRNPTLGSKPYMARIMLEQIIPLSRKWVENDRDALHINGKVPERRLELRAGKFDVADFFDLNSAGSDSHLQFMNWTVDNNGGYDYAADTRGYTFGFLIEYQSPGWAARFGETLMPKVANGIDLDWDLRRARAENYEVELRPRLARGGPTIFRLLAYVNHANMGAYRQANEDFLSGLTLKPDVISTRMQGRVKYGFGINVEQPLSKSIVAFGRWGWSEPHNESFVYTEVNETIEAGIAFRGSLWQRGCDRLGLAFASNGISRDHQRYLALGGDGFLLGDGGLNYGRENILESYYTAHLWRGVFTGPDVQFINNPGYNRDRGPVLVPGWRAHLDF